MVNYDKGSNPHPSGYTVIPRGSSRTQLYRGKIAYDEPRHEPREDGVTYHGSDDTSLKLRRNYMRDYMLEYQRRKKREKDNDKILNATTEQRL